MPPRTRPTPTGTAGLPAALAFLHTMWAIDHQLHSLSKHMERTLGITGPQRLALRVLARTSGMTAGELATALHLHPSTVTGIVQRLTRRRLVSRRVDPGDRRRAVLRVTAAARAYRRPTAGTIEAAMQRTLRAVPPASAAAARRVLAFLLRELQADGAAATARPPSRRS